jgi:hypothetical protein
VLVQKLVSKVKLVVRSTAIGGARIVVYVDFSDGIHFLSALERLRHYRECFGWLCLVDVFE